MSGDWVCLGLFITAVIGVVVYDLGMAAIRAYERKR